MPGEEIELLGFGEAPGHETVKGAPFSAKAVTEKTHVLADGNRIHRTTESAIYRDSEGRFRREFTFAGIGPLAANRQPRPVIVIRDPGTRTAFALDPEHKIARSLPGPLGGGHGALKERFAERLKKMEASGEVKTEALGTKTMAGVSAEGKRFTRVIPAGEIGNEKPIEVSTEVWYSKELGIVVMVKRSDPRVGLTTYQVTSVQRKEPDPKLFRVPADYTVKEMPKRPMRDFGGHGPGMGHGMGHDMGPGQGQQPPPKPEL